MQLIRWRSRRPLRQWLFCDACDLALRNRWWDRILARREGWRFARSGLVWCPAHERPKHRRPSAWVSDEPGPL